MTTGEKALVVVIVGGVLYMVFGKTEERQSYDQRAAPAATAERVMSYAGLIMKWGSTHGLDPALIASVITVESSGNPNARGAAGEIGLMQIIPSSIGSWVDENVIRQLSDPSTNIRVGTTYLRQMIDVKGGNVLAGVASYNYGPGRVVVNERGNFSAPQSVVNYVTNVMSYGDFYRAQFTARLGTFYTNIFGSGKLILDGLRRGA